MILLSWPITSDAAGNAAAQASANIVKVEVKIGGLQNHIFADDTAYKVSGTCSHDGGVVAVVLEDAAGAQSGFGRADCVRWKWDAEIESGLELLAVGTVTIKADYLYEGNQATQATKDIERSDSVVWVRFDIASVSAINNNNAGTYAISGTCSNVDQNVVVDAGGVSGTGVCTARQQSRRPR